MSETANEALRGQVIKALRRIQDPEIPVNIYDLGLVYDLTVDDSGSVHVRMTLTSPACPVAGMLVKQVEQSARGVEGVQDARVELVWDPPWTMERMTDAARLELNLEPGQSPMRGRGPSFIQLDTRRDKS